jgi:hypothetical protein
MVCLNGSGYSGRAFVNGLDIFRNFVLIWRGTDSKSNPAGGKPAHFAW